MGRARLAGSGVAPLGALAEAPDELLGLAHRQVAVLDDPEQARLRGGIGAADGAGVALGDPALADGLLDGRVEVEEAQRVRDGRAGLADALGHLFLGEAELVDQLAVGMGLLDRIEVLALDVLDEGELELVARRELAHDRRHPLEPGQLRCPDAALAGDELVAVERLGDEDRLDDAVVADARREALELRDVEALARLVRVPADARDRDLARGRDRGRALWDERGEAAAEPAGRSLRSDRHQSTIA